jgi:hypothetical protein
MTCFKKCDFPGAHSVIKIGGDYRKKGEGGFRLLLLIQRFYPTQNYLVTPVPAQFQRSANVVQTLHGFGSECCAIENENKPLDQIDL